MPAFITLDREKPMSAILRVCGVGGGGCNAVESMIKKGLNGVEYIVVNTDAQVLDSNPAQHKIQIGTRITKGLGAGADPNVGKKATEEDKEKIAEVLTGSDMVFITAGMGGGTGTGGAPVVAEVAKSLGSLVVAIVTKPFKWEGKQRMMNAERGIQELKKYVDSLIVIPNERLLNILDKNINAFAAFDKPNEVLYEATRGIADIITVRGLINVDFADVRSVMDSSGVAIMGCGIASGENRAIEAAQKAISSPLLEGMNIKGAKSLLLNVTGSSNLSMNEVHEGSNIIFQAAGEETNVIFGCVLKEEMLDHVSFTVIATGFDAGEKMFEPSVNEKKEDNFINVLRDRMKLPTVKNLESEDLDRPTFIRSAEKLMEDSDEPNPQPEHFFENLRKPVYEKQIKEEAKGFFESLNDDDEEASSEFLRKIMD